MLTITLIPSGMSPVTLVPSRVAPAADAGARPVVALVGVAIADTGSAAGEAPVSCLAPVALLTKRPWAALALPGELVTEPSDGAFQAAATG